MKPAVQFEIQSRKEQKFGPIKITRQIEGGLDDFSGRDIDFFHTELEIQLKNGNYSIPVTPTAGLEVEIEPDTSCHLEIATRQVGEGSEISTIITDFSVDFSRPIVLDNVLAVLANLPEIFDDNNLELMKVFLRPFGQEDVVETFNHLGKNFSKRIEASFGLLGRFESYIKQNTERLKKGILQEEVKQKINDTSQQTILPRIHLQKIIGKPKKKGKSWQLNLSFTGRVNYLDIPVRRFVDFQLPYMIIPALHADLAKLLTQKPLSSAKLKIDSLNIEGLIKEFFQLIDSYQGNFHMKAYLPKIALDLTLPELSRLNLQVFSKEIHDIKGRFSGTNHPQEIALQTETIEIFSKSSRIFCQGSIKLSVQGKRDLLVERLFQLWRGKRWQPGGASLQMKWQLLPNSMMGHWLVDLKQTHPNLQESLTGRMKIKTCSLQGMMDIQTDPKSQQLMSRQTKIIFQSNYSGENFQLRNSRRRIHADLSDGILNGEIVYRYNRQLKISLQGSRDFSTRINHKLKAIPELDILKDDLHVQIEGRTKYHLELLLNFKNNEFKNGSIKKSQVSYDLESMQVNWNRYHLQVKQPIHLYGRVREGRLDANGFGHLDLALHWDFKSFHPEIFKDNEKINLFYKPIQAGKIFIVIEDGGRLSVRGSGKGSMDGQLFNAILHPEEKLDRWLDVLENPGLIKHLYRLLVFFAGDKAEIFYELRKIATLTKRSFQKENIKELGDVLPVDKMVQVLTDVSKRKDFREKFRTLILSLIDGKGLAKSLARELIQNLFPGHYKNYRNEIHKLINIAATLVNPIVLTRKVYPEVRINKKNHSQYLSANEIYQTLLDKKWTNEFHEKLEMVGHYLRIAQLEWILAREPYCYDFQSEHLRTVFALKKRIHLAREQFGGPAYLPQIIYINFFLADISEYFALKQEDLTPPCNRWIRKGYLGPAEAAILLQAILASPIQERDVQLNLKFLYDFFIAKPENFFLYTLIEASDGSARVLTQVLYRLLNCRQDLLKEELDFSILFSDRLKLKLPTRNLLVKDPAKSYYDALARIAQKILNRRTEYDSLKNHLQMYRHRKLSPQKTDHDKKLQQEAQKLIAQADEYGRTLKITDKNHKQQQEARGLYQSAFAACRSLLEKNPLAFQEKWFKKFWQRNYEALVVRSVVRNYQQDVDRVGNWLHTMSGKQKFAGEQDLLSTCIDVLYYHSSDRKQLHNDPLVRLLIEPPVGHYDFSIISCMGIITYGESGTELAETFQRLKKQRGVDTLRADTKIMRSLRANARWIEKKIAEVSTPFGFLGYSQGCPNFLMAEALMRGGTPEQREKMSLLRTRNLLYGATNGSVHGDTANLKYFRFIKQVELFIKKFRKYFSDNLQDYLLEALSLFMVSRRFIHITGGMSSVSSKATRNLAHYGQFAEDVPSCLMRGVVEEMTLPEANEMLSNLLTIQAMSNLHDTQVAADDAVAEFTRVQTEANRVLQRNHIPSFIQRTHHWAPLCKEVDFLTTTRDRELAIFDTPKDRHVFPWVEVNARFGVIKSD